MALISGMVAIYLKEVTVSDSCALIPGYRKKQLITAALVLCLYMVVPAIVLSIRGLPVFNVMALLLLIAGTLVAHTDNTQLMGRQFLPLVPIWLAYELLDIQPNFEFIGSFSQLTGFSSNTPFALLVIALAVIIGGRFVIRFMRGETIYPQSPQISQTSYILATYDKVDPVSAKFLSGKMSRLYRRMKEERRRYSDLIRLYQYALFNPRSTLFADPTLSTVVIFYLYMYYLVYHSKSFDTVLELAPLLFMIYQLMAVGVTTEFLQHRDRLPSLWLQSPLPARTDITRAVIFTYLAVAGKQYLKVSLALALLPVFVPAYARPEYLLLIAVGLLPYIFLIALSLAQSEEITSPTCWGWAVFNLVFSMVMFLFNISFSHDFKNPLAYHVFLLLMIPVSAVYLWYVYRGWATDTEMNFAGPEATL
jgi:hypothetical protein